MSSGKKRRAIARAAIAEALETRRLLAIFTVNTLADTVDANPSITSLREAVNDANTAAGSDDIHFDASLAGGTISLQTALADLSETVNIVGLGASQLTIERDTTAATKFRIFTINSGVTSAITGLTLAKGDVIGPGGAIHSSGNLLISNCVIRDSKSTGGAGADTGFGSGLVNGFGGGVFTSGAGASLTMIDTTVSGNTATGGRGGTGGIGSGGGMGAGGAVFVDSGLAFIITSTLSGNQAIGGLGGDGGGPYGGTSGGGGDQGNFGGGAGVLASGGGFGGGGASFGGGPGQFGGAAGANGAGGGGGGGLGGALFARGGTVTITNSTVSGNSATGGKGGNVQFNSGGTSGPGSGGSGAGGGVFNHAANVGLHSVTVASNTSTGGAAGTGGVGGATAGASQGGGLFNNAAGTAFSFKNSILAYGTAATGPDAEGTFTSGDYNLIQQTSAITFGGGDPVSHNITGQDPLLGALAPNGGPTQTRALSAISPALDKGKSFGVTTDQRGETRPTDFPGFANAAGGDGADMGAFELDALPTFTWDGAPDGGGSSADTRWTTATNWVGDIAPTAGADLVFGAAGAVGRSTVNDFPDDTVFNTITFNDINYTVTELSTDANSIQLNAGFTSNVSGVVMTDLGPQFAPDVTLLNDQTFTSSGNLIVNFLGDINLNSRNLTFDADVALFVNGVISGDGTITKNGTDTVAFNSDNTYTGLTQINNGNIRAGADNALGTTGALDEVQQVTLSGNPGGSLTLTFDGETTPAIAANATAQDVEDELNALDTIGGVGGSVDVTAVSGGYLVTFGGTLSQTNVTQMVAQGQAGTLASVSTVTEGSPGARAEVQTVTLSGSAAGTFTLTFNGQTTSAILASATGQEVEDALNALDTIGRVGGSVDVSRAGNVFTITFGGALSQVDVTQLIASGQSGAIATAATVAEGHAAEAYAGTIVTNDGRVAIVGGVSIPENLAIDGNGVAGAGAIVGVNGSNTLFGPLKLNGNAAIANNGSGTTLTVSSAVNLQNFTFSVIGIQNILFNGKISGTGNLSIATGGTIFIANDSNDFTGTSGAVAGTLGGIGKVAGLNVAGTAVLAPGFSPGIFASGSLDLTNGDLNIELNGTTVGTQYDQVNVTGTVDVSGAVLNLDVGFTPTLGNQFVIINNDSTDAVIGIFNGLNEGAIFTADGSTFQISYAGQTGNDVVLTAVTAVVVATHDYGDAPDTFATTLASNGARHEPNFFFLGSARDLEVDGQPNATATGDDAAGTPDDEDGVTFGTLIPGQTATVTVVVGDPGASPFTPILNAWFDWDGNGDFTAGFNHTIVNQVVSVGSNTLTISVPSTTTLGPKFARFRIANAGGVNYNGALNNGEVEDYQVNIVAAPPLDYGDAPNTYATTLASNGPRHEPNFFFLGSTRDLEADGQPNATATGDDAAGTPDDEDGVTFGGLYVGQAATITVVVGDPGASPFTPILNAWIDWEGDGNFTAGFNHAIVNQVVSVGTNTLTINVPPSATAGTTFARFRIANAGGAASTGALNNGEVEDYQVSIVQPVPLDFGDAPATYGTTLANDGARHDNGGPTLGSERDTELNGAPNATATGDDTTGTPDDEEGVTLPVFAPGASSRVSIVTGGPDARVEGYFDWNADGDFTDPGEFVINAVASAGTTLYTVTVPATAVVGSTFARFRVQTDSVTAAAASPIGLHPDGEVEDYQITVTNTIDYGDAPDTYSTLFASDGARHAPNGILLGTLRDTEADGQPTATANGDDTNGSDDEDGVTFTESIQPGRTVKMDVFITSPTNENGKLQSFFDWNADGDFADPGEKDPDNLNVVPGNNTISILVPATAVIGTTFARFRISSEEAQNTTYFGVAGDGEVEDYQITVDTPTFDFGDAPNSYKTDKTSAGPRHAPFGFILGSTRDVETDVVPDGNATKDDTTDSDDEDGVSFGGSLVAGGTVSVTVVVGGTGGSGSTPTLNAYFDWNDDGDFTDSGERAFANTVLTTGSNTLSLSVPATATTGDTFARFRLTGFAETTSDPGGERPDGEVEDYKITIAAAAPTHDFGDAPDTYKTLLASDGARHEPNFFFLGSARDLEADGQPNATATGDDTAGTDDEDGVTIGALVINQTATITVVVGDPGTSPFTPILNAWFDWEGDGDFAAPFNHIIVNQVVSVGSNTLTFNVPPGATAGTTFARFRIANAGGVGPDGALDNGEVEDYQVTVSAFQPGAISGQKFNDLDGDGTNDGGTDPGLPGWTIELDKDANGTVDASVSTGSGGAYSFTNLAAGTYRIREVGQAGWIQTTVNPSDVTVVSGTNSTGNNFGNFQLAAISGKKFNDLDGDGTDDGGTDPGLAGWTIQLDKDANGTVEATTVTGPGGTYSFTGLTAGIYRVREVGQVGWSQTTINPADVTVTSGTNSTGNNFGNRLTPVNNGSISGKKFKDLDCDGKKDSNEPGIGGVTINLDFNADGSVDQTTTTDSGGNYKFSNLVAGTYRIREVVPLGYTQTSPNPADINLAAGQNVTSVNFGNAYGKPAFTINDVTKNEGNSGYTYFTFTVTKHGDPNKSGYVYYQTASGSASSSSDYYSIPKTQLYFSSGQTTRTVTVKVKGDTTSEPDETFFVNLSSNSSGTTIADPQGVGTIKNDDLPPGPPPPTICIDDVTLNEGNNGQTDFTFTITRSGNVTGASDVYWSTAPGSASSSSDFTGVPSTLVHFNANETTKTVTVKVNGDLTCESDETFCVNLSGAVGATISDGQGIGKIKNDDPSPPPPPVSPPPPPAGPSNIANTGTDPCDSTKTGLFVYGTDLGDSIQVLRSGTILVVTINSQNKGTFAITGGIYVYAGKGSDIITLDPTDTHNAVVYCGDGADSVTGGGGSNVLLGEAGNDTCVGGALRDILIGGTGSDSLVGNNGDDILITGRTAYDSDIPSLCLLQKEWLRTDQTYSQRRDHIRGGGGLNGSVFLSSPRLFDDSAKDTAQGGGGTDLFFARTGGTYQDSGPDFSAGTESVFDTP